MAEPVPQLHDGCPSLESIIEEASSLIAQNSHPQWIPFPDGTPSNSRTSMFASSEINDVIDFSLVPDNFFDVPQHRTREPTPSMGPDRAYPQQPSSAVKTSEGGGSRRLSLNGQIDSQQHGIAARYHDSQSPRPNPPQPMSTEDFRTSYYQQSSTEQPDLFNADYRSVEAPYESGLDCQGEAPIDYDGQPTRCGGLNQARVPDGSQDITSQVDVARKKRSREELDSEESSRPWTAHSHYRRLAQDQQPAASNSGQRPQGYGSRRSSALSWQAVPNEKQLADKKRRLDSGDAFAVSTTGPEERSSARRRLEFPTTSIDSAAQNQAAVPNNQTAPRPRAIASARSKKKASKAPKRRFGRNKKRRYHGELLQQSDDSLIFREDGKHEWEPTAYHEDLRREMIQEMAQFGSYDETPVAGPMEYDVTAFNPTQQDWHFQGHQGWHSGQDRLMYRFERRGRRDPPYQPGPLRFQNHIILNNDGEVITAWRDIPLTVSSAIEGGRMENIQRTDSRITVQDFQDRMPSMVTAKQQLQRRSAFTNRMLRYRLANGLASWHPREGSQVIKDIMLRHLTREQITRNTTKGFPGLSTEERTEIEDGNKKSQKYKNRAGGRSKQAKISATGNQSRNDDENDFAMAADDQDIDADGDFVSDDEAELGDEDGDEDGDFSPE